MSSRSFRLSELIEELQRIQNSPISPEAVKVGQAQVFISLRSPTEPAKILVMRGNIEIRDFGAYIDIGITQ